MLRPSPTANACPPCCDAPSLQATQTLALCLMALLLLSGAQAGRTLAEAPAAGPAAGPTMGPVMAPEGAPTPAPAVTGTYGFDADSAVAGEEAPQAKMLMMDEPMASPPVEAPAEAPAPGERSRLPCLLC